MLILFAIGRESPTGFLEEFQYHLFFCVKIPTGKVENKEEKGQQN